MDCILHIGTNKTGTSSLQKILSENSSALRARGILYPQAGRDFGNKCLDRHVGLRLAALPASVKGNGMAGALGLIAPQKREAYRARFIASLDEELARSHDMKSVILSDEALYIFSEEHTVRQVRELLCTRFDRVHVVCYVRRPDKYLVSAHSQFVKMGGTLSFNDFLSQKIQEQLYFPRLRLWIESFGRESVSLRCFERQFLQGGDLLRDFFVTSGLMSGSEVESWSKDLRAFRTNEGLSELGSEVLRRLNASLSDIPDVAHRRRQQNKLRNIVSREYAGKGPVVSDAVAQDIFEAFRDDHKAMVSAFGLERDVIYRLQDMLNDCVPEQEAERISDAAISEAVQKVGVLARTKKV